MKKTILAILLLIGLGNIGFAQDFTFDELVKLRSEKFPSFETYVHDRGYNLDHLESGTRCTVFRNEDDVISYCNFYDNGYSYRSHVGIKFETGSREMYEKIKRSVESSLKYHKTNLRRYRHHHYIEHIYANDDIVVHLYDISYDNDNKPYYQIEIYSIYSGYDGCYRWERW